MSIPRGYLILCSYYEPLYITETYLNRIKSEIFVINGLL